MLREDFLQQNAFMESDSYSSYERQHTLLQLILDCDTMSRAALEQNRDIIEQLFKLPAREQIGRAKTVEGDGFRAAYAKIEQDLKQQIQDALAGGETL